MPNEFTQPVIAIVGPTATGKTALSVQVAQALGGVVVSADSRVVYRGLDIGTAKPTLAEQGGVTHYLIDVVDPTDTFSVARYAELAEPLLAHLAQPILVAGGTGLYLKALLQEDFVPPVPPNPQWRQALLQAYTPQALYQQLAERDPVRAAALHPNDTVRVLRALEIIEATGQPVPQSQPRRARPPVLWVGLTWQDRDRHRALIDARIEAMLAAGWLEEVETLLQRWGPEAQALNVTHGYPELVRVLQGQCTLAEAVEDIRVQIHQYARRQRTWFRRNPHIQWFYLDESPLDAVAQWVLERAHSNR
jgi:tRNA dimethylallyltransferase